MVLGGGMALTEAARSSMGGVHTKQNLHLLHQLNKGWFFLYGMFKPCANFVGITVISAPVSSKKINLFLFYATFHKILWSLCWITGKGSYSQPQ